jgi:hypothetical protein
MRALFVVILLGLAARVAVAQPSAEDKKEAKAAFARAEAAEKRKDWRTAIDEYQHAYDVLPHPDVLSNIALDLERLEEYRDAATFYRRYLDESPDASDRDRVEKLIEKLRARPAALTITTDPDGAEVTLDGKRLGPSPVVAKVSGTVEIEVTDASGTATRTITVEFGEPATIHVPVMARSGYLVVSSNVAGAQILLDDQPIGVTPFSGEVPAGSHNVVVSMEGWSSYERPVDVPAEGSTQMTANLVRPAGWVAPLVEPKQPRAYFLVSGGADATGETGRMYGLMFGVHRGPWSFGLGYGFMSEAAGFALEAKVSLTKTKIRPYLRASTLLGSRSTLAVHAGVLGAITLGEGARAQTAVFVEAGAGMAKGTNADSGEDETLLFVPIMGGLQFSY